MKYMTRWHIKEENMEAAVNRFKNDPPEVPAGVTMLGRWHQMATGYGFALIESDDPIAVARYAAAWSDLVHQEIFPVIDDSEVAQAL
jgi:hypothetical protein